MGDQAGGQSPNWKQAGGPVETGLIKEEHLREGQNRQDGRQALGGAATDAHLEYAGSTVCARVGVSPA